jgi:membrane-bound ClpP family serine protease
MAEPDPVLVRRRRIAGWADLGQRAGYLLFGVAVVLFVVGFATGFPGWLGASVIGLLVAGSAVLAPAIVFGYAVRAADRDDREHGRL